MLAPDGVFASNTSTLADHRASPRRARGPSASSACTSSRRSHKMKLVEIIRGQADERRDPRARLRLRGRARQDADRRQRFARLLHQPRLRHLRDGRRGDARRGHRRAADRARRARRRHAGRAARGPRRDLALALGPRPRADARRLAGRGPQLRAVGAARRWSSSMVKELGRPGRAGGGGFYDYPQGEPKRLWPGLRAHFAKARRRRRHRRAEAAPALPPVDRDRALPGRRRADERRRSQHRLDLRHRLSGLDRRRDPVHRVGRQASASSPTPPRSPSATATASRSPTQRSTPR